MRKFVLIVDCSNSNIPGGCKAKFVIERRILVKKFHASRRDKAYIHSVIAIIEIENHSRRILSTGIDC